MSDKDTHSVIDNTRIAAALSLLVVFTAGAIVSVIGRLPASFGGPGDPDHVLRNFLTRGTALSPPPIPMLAMVFFAVVARVHGRAGLLGLVGALVLAGLFIIGGIGEGLWSARFGAVATVIQTVSVVLSATILGLSVWGVVVRARRHEP